MIDESFLTTEEVLEYLQVNLRTVYRLIKAGKIRRSASAGSGGSGSATSTPGSRASGRARRVPRPRSTPRRRRRPPARPRVLVVDDEASIRDLLAKTLALAEYDVDLAPDGRAGLERLRMIPYDLLITDLKMPGVDGLAVIREARRLKADMPVIIITGLLDRSERHRGGQPRRVRLPHQALPRPPGPRRRRQSARRIARTRHAESQPLFHSFSRPSRPREAFEAPDGKGA